MSKKTVTAAMTALAIAWGASAAADGPRISTFHNHVEALSRERGVTIPEAVALAKSWGIEGVDVFAAFDKGESAEILAAGMQPSTYVLSVDFAHCDDTQKVERAFAFVSERKCPRIMLVSGYLNPGENREAAWLAMRPRLRDFVARAGKLGVKVELEDFDSREAVVGSADHLRRAFREIPDLGHVFDTGNYSCWGDDPVAAMREFRTRIGHVHVKDLSADGMPVAAGAGRLPVRAMVGELVKDGYSGWLTIECFGTTNQVGAILETAADCLKEVIKENRK